MLGLILDTSTDHSLIALSKNQKVIASKTLAHEQNLSKSLLPSIHQLLVENNISLKDLFKISVGVGPGSYTGTRIAVATAESLALALSVPLYPFCSLLAFLPFDLPQGPFAFVSNTHQSTWFLLKGYFEEGIVKASFSHHILPQIDALPFLKDVPSVLSFSKDHLQDHLTEETRLYPAQANFHSLVTHLAELEKLPPEKPKIFYLHQF